MRNIKNLDSYILQHCSYSNEEFDIIALEITNWSKYTNYIKCFRINEIPTCKYSLGTGSDYYLYVRESKDLGNYDSVFTEHGFNVLIHGENFELYNNLQFQSKLKLTIPSSNKLEDVPEWIVDFVKKCGSNNHEKNILVSNMMFTINPQVLMKPIIDRFWVSGETILITGETSVGKSLFSTNLALDLACQPGNLFLDTFKIPEIKKVLFLQSAFTHHELKSRIQSIINSYPVYKNALQNIFYMGYQDNIKLYGDILQDTNLRNSIIYSLEHNKPDVVVIDPVSSYFKSDLSMFRYFLNDIASFFQKMKIDVCFVESNNHLQSILYDFVDLCFVIEKTDNQRYLLKNIKSRNRKQHDDYGILLDSLRFRIMNSKTLILEEMKPIDQHVLRYLESLQSKSPNKSQNQVLQDIKKILENIDFSPNSISKIRDSLESLERMSLIKQKKIQNTITYKVL